MPANAMRGRGAWRPRLLASAVLWTLFAAAVFVLSTVSVEVQGTETRLLYTAHFSYGAPAPLSWVTPVSVIAAVVVLMVLCLLSHGLRRSVALGAAATLSLVASQLLKQQWLSRPSLLSEAEFNTFPSGHVTVFAVLAGGLVWALPRAARSVASWAGAALVSLAAVQLIMHAWHRVSDVVGGIALTAAIFALSAFLFRFRAGEKHSFRTMNWLGTLLILASAAVGAGALLARSFNILLLTCCVLCVGVSLLAVRSMRRAV